MIHWVYSYKNGRKKRRMTRNGGDLPSGNSFSLPWKQKSNIHKLSLRTNESA